MNDTGLHQRLRPGGLDRVWEATKTVTAHDQHVLEASVAYLGQYRKPVLGAFAAVAQPHTENVFTSVHIDTDHHIRWTIDHRTVGTDLHHHGIYVQKGDSTRQGAGSAIR